MLLIAYTTVRLSTLLATSIYKGLEVVLKYKDIKLYAIRDPINKEKYIILMFITLRLIKGKRNASVT